jgi:ABC-type branched-subunit amino acid transport system permease subunit
MIGKWILIFGVVLVVVGAVVWLVESLGLPLGRLPGDIRMRGFYFPIVTCIIASIVLTVLLNLLLWFFRR